MLVTAKRLAGIEDFRLHDFRHCFITRMRRLGLHQEVIMAITGHATDAMFRRYRKVDDMDLWQMVELGRKRDQDQAASENGASS